MRRHELDLFSLLAGLVLGVVAVVALLEVTAGVDVDGRWLFPGMLVAFGAIGLLTSLRGLRSDRPDVGVPEDSRDLDEVGDRTR